MTSCEWFTCCCLSSLSEQNKSALTDLDLQRFDTVGWASGRAWGVGVVICLARCKLFAYGPSDATAIPKPLYLLRHLHPDWFLAVWYRLTQVVLEKRLLNGCSVVAGLQD